MHNLVGGLTVHLRNNVKKGTLIYEREVLFLRNEWTLWEKSSKMFIKVVKRLPGFTGPFIVYRRRDFYQNKDK